MSAKEQLKPEYVFEVSWEVCNKVGGIYTVLSTKAKEIQKTLNDNLIMIGPDVYKGNGTNDFIPDDTLFESWREVIADEEWKISIGRWDIPGKPIAILVDFSALFNKKNEIFSDLWFKYQLDSLIGGGDYIEPALFGYCAGMVIASFYDHYLTYDTKIIAQFHEWMTGAGILYLKDKARNIATVFTTHATVIGRCIAGSGRPFYSMFDSYDADNIAKEFNVVAKHSLEKASAKNADSFTTVSELTGKECLKFLGKSPDVITHNGIDISSVPLKKDLAEKRALARKKIFQVANALFDMPLPEDSLLIIKSGRYEFRNKGIDLFIDTLSAIKARGDLKKDVIAFIFVPSDVIGPRKDLLDRIANPNYHNPTTGEILTHDIRNNHSDAILNRIKADGLINSPDDKVKVVFVPTYIDGADGIFNTTYYDTLVGFDLAIFPSYYEPWGYTPLEGMAYHVPAVTTNVSGFGIAIQSLETQSLDGAYVIERTDYNEKEVVKDIADIIVNFSCKSAVEIKKASDDAFEMSKFFTWDKQLEKYYVAYDEALQAKEVESLPVLQKLSENLWCSWNYTAMDLFEGIDPELWGKVNHNPVAFLKALPFGRFRELDKEADFMNHLRSVEKAFDSYMDVEPYSTLRVAYFSMEYGLNSYIKLYSGGLGVLAGDYLKEASDAAVSITAVGLCYKNGYFKQTFSQQGLQVAEADRQDFRNLPLKIVEKKDGKPLMISLDYPGRRLYAQVWLLQVGRVNLYLLDTCVAENLSKEDKDITKQLYGGNKDTRLKQEYLLGVGGIQLLNALEMDYDIYHCNEGHAAFIGIERLYNFIKKESLQFDEALEVVRASTLFTTHTSVPAAFDTFSNEMMYAYFGARLTETGVPWEKWMGLGRANDQDLYEPLSMPYLAAKISQEINAVSKLHKLATCRLFNVLYKDYNVSELHIGSVTNGVHYATWTSKTWQQLYKQTFEEGFLSHLSDGTYWKKIHEVPDADIWAIRNKMKLGLISSLKEKLALNAENHQNPNRLRQSIHALDENALLIGFARRFATYKRSDLLFNDVNRLLKIISSYNRPVKFLFAGKAHPADGAGIDIIKHIISITENKDFANNIIFLENYDMDTASKLVQGVDIWLNTPIRLMEASGTSGMKAIMNGVMNFSVPDGWWAEAYRPDAGWSLAMEETYKHQDLQDKVDADAIYTTLENEIVPLYYDRNEEGLPVNWIKHIKNSIEHIAPEFTMTRMLIDYQENFYKKLFQRSVKMRSNDFAAAKELTIWKRKMEESWNDIDILSTDVTIRKKSADSSEKEFITSIILDLGKIPDDEIGVEVIIVDKNEPDQEKRLYAAKELTLVKSKNSIVTFECNLTLKQRVHYDYSFRIFPKHQLLPHRQDFALLRLV